MQQVDTIKLCENVARLEAKEIELENRLAHLLAMEGETTKALAQVRFERALIEERIAAKEMQRL